MGDGGEGMREILDVKERIAEKIARHEEELEFLRRNLAALDSMIGQSSFARASSMRAAGGGDGGAGGEDEAGGGEDGIPITSADGGAEVAVARVTPDEVLITVSEGAEIDPEAAPLRTFFMDSVMARMRRQDEEGGEAPISCDVGAEGGRLRSISVTNYRSRERADEIVSAAKWALSRAAAGRG